MQIYYMLGADVGGKILMADARNETKKQNPLIQRVLLAFFSEPGRDSSCVCISLNYKNLYL
jgi:hypothetical protein